MTTVIIGQASVFRDGSQLTVAPLGPEDLPPLLAMLARCSRATLRHRFHGFTDGVSHVVDLTNRWDHHSVVARAGSECIGLATLAVCGEGPAACGEGPDADGGREELGVLVEDAWQRRGVGRRLVGRLVTDARGRGVEELSADVLAEDVFALRALGRIGSVSNTLERGVCHVRVTIASTGSTPGADERQAGRDDR